jgi:hypothetical protein
MMTGHTIPSLHDWADAHSEDIAAGMSCLPVNEAVSAQIAHRVARACESNLHTLDTMMEYVSTAHGLHKASALARANGNMEWAHELFEMAQLFLHYTVGDIAAIAVMSRTSAPNSSGVNAVH